MYVFYFTYLFILYRTQLPIYDYYIGHERYFWELESHKCLLNHFFNENNCRINKNLFFINVGIDLNLEEKNFMENYFSNKEHFNNINCTINSQNKYIKEVENIRIGKDKVIIFIPLFIGFAGLFLD